MHFLSKGKLFAVLSGLFVLVGLSFGRMISVDRPFDQQTAASDHDDGRVQVRVFRGPTDTSGDHHFAPHGYWIKQPADKQTSDYWNHHYGRVHIKVFRGPGHEHHFAPHGYWIKQPADDHHDG